MSISYGPPVNTTGSYMYLDPKNQDSYDSGTTVIHTVEGNSTSWNVVNNPTFNSIGYFSFNGTNTSLQTQSVDVGLSPRDGDYTWCGWLRFGAFTGNYRNIFCANATGGIQGFGIMLDNTTNRIRYEIYGTTGGRQIKYSYTTSYLNTWNYWTVTIDRTNLRGRTYVNGVLVNSYSLLDWTNAQLTSKATIGRYFSSGIWYYDGDVGPVQIYNKVLNIDEIKQNFKSLQTRFNI